MQKYNLFRNRPIAKSGDFSLHRGKKILQFQIIGVFLQSIYNPQNPLTMKKVLSILMVAMFATAVMSCSKDKDDESTLNIPDNTLVYDGVTYHMNTVQDRYHEELTLVMAESEEADTSGESLIRFDGLHIRPGMWNHTTNLVSPDANDEYGIYFFLSDGSSIRAYGYPDGQGQYSIGGNIFDDYYEQEPIFTSGTFSISGNNDGTPITVTLDCVLKNGKTLQMKLVTNSIDVN